MTDDDILRIPLRCRRGRLLERCASLPVAGKWVNRARKVWRKRYLASIKGEGKNALISEVLRHESGREFQSALSAWLDTPAAGIAVSPISRPGPELRCSVVINTVDRAADLEITLAALREEWDEQRDELIVVLGPTGDHSEEVLRSSPVPCAVIRCPEKNLAISRNLGLHAARGKYVAFIDDDASPAKGWLPALLAPLEQNGDVAISAGFVMDGEGRRFLNQHVVADTLGRAWWFPEADPAYRKIRETGADRSFLTATGCNMAFRRQVLDEIGGFDPFYRYFLEETDVVWRILQSGKRCVPSPASIVLHRLGDNLARKPSFDIAQRATIIRSQIHFAGKFSKGLVPPGEIASAIWERALADLEKIGWDCGPARCQEGACGSLQAGYLRTVADELRLDSRGDSSSLSGLSRTEQKVPK